jgi:hypothetical protein
VRASGWRAAEKISGADHHIARKADDCTRAILVEIHSGNVSDIDHKLKTVTQLLQQQARRDFPASPPAAKASSVWCPSVCSHAHSRRGGCWAEPPSFFVCSVRSAISRNISGLSRHSRGRRILVSATSVAAFGSLAGLLISLIRRHSCLSQATIVVVRSARLASQNTFRSPRGALPNAVPSNALFKKSLPGRRTSRQAPASPARTTARSPSPRIGHASAT